MWKSGGFDCTGWYLGFMGEMREFANQPASVETLEEIKSRLGNAMMQVDELVRLQQLQKNKQCSCWDGHSAIRHEHVHASFQSLKPKKIKKFFVTIIYSKISIYKFFDYN